MSDVKYYSQILWEHIDSQITTNCFKIYTYNCFNEYGFGVNRLQFSVQNYKNRIHLSSYLTPQKVFNYLAKFQELKDKNEIEKYINDKSYTTSFIIQSKKKIITSFLNRQEYGGQCVRIAISDKTEDFLDSEKAYMPFYDYLSILQIMKNFRDNYVTIFNSLILNKKLDDLNLNVSDLTNKLKAYYSEMTSKTHWSASSENIIPTEESATIIIDANQTEEEELEISSSSSTRNHSIIEIETKDLHEEMTSFINEESNNIDLGLDKNPSKQDRSQADVLNCDFTEKILNNDIINLEMYISNIINERVPFFKFCKLIECKLVPESISYADTLLPGFTDPEVNAILYLSTIYTKYYINQHLTQNKDLPSSVIPMLINGKNPTKLNLSIMYDLYLYMTYYTLLKTQLKEKDYNSINNRDFICFILKSIASPLVFSFIKNLDKEIVVSEICNRYDKYKEAGVFKKLEDNISNKFGGIQSILKSAIETEVARTFDVVKNNFGSFTIDKMLIKCKDIKLSKLDIDHFKKYPFSLEQIIKVIALEFSFKKHNKVDFKEIASELKIKDFGDIDTEILKFYGVKEKKFDNSNLIRFVEENIKDQNILQQSLNVCKLINKSKLDLKGKNIDLTILPELVLKAVWLWDTENDEKVASSYIYFTKRISESSLDKTMILSLLNNIEEMKPSNFVESLKAVEL